MESIAFIGFAGFHLHPMKSLGRDQKQAVRLGQKKPSFHPILHSAANKIIDFIKTMAMKIKGYTGAGCDTVVAVYVFLLQLRFGMQNLSPLPFSSPYFQSLVPTILHYGDFCNVNLPLCNGRFYSEWYTFLVNEYKNGCKELYVQGQEESLYPDCRKHLKSRFSALKCAI